MERGEPSGGDPSLMGPTGGINDPSLMGSLCVIDYPSLMGPFGGVGGGLQSQMNDTPENGPSNQSMEVHANNGNEESPGDGAARITEVGSSTAGKNKKKRGDRQDGPQPNKRSLHRVTSQQLEILEGFFSVCAHPDDNQRRQLSESTGLLLHQVKFWFQNKRTHVKHLSGREENYRLKVENDTLKEENNRLRQLQSNAPAPAPCPRCINDPGHLLLEKEVERLKDLNQMLQQELQLLQSTVNEIPMPMDSASGAFHLDPSLENVFVVQHDEQMLANLTQNAAQELLILANPNSPLWLNVPGGSFETLNMVAYAQTFPGQMGVDTMALKTEATRASAVVMLEPKSLVEFLMDAESYGTMLPGLVSSAATTKVYSCPTGREEYYDGAMQMMTVELVFPSPLVAARKCTFVRYCKRLEQQGAIAVVDVSLDDGARCRKMPSGLLIQPIRYNSCKVTAIDHVLVDGTNTHGLFEPCPSGLLFGARRRVTSMARQCARIRDVFHVTNCTLNVTSRGRKTIMKLADNLLANFTSSVAAYPEDAWTVQCGLGTEQDIKIMYKTQNESSSSSHTAVVCASASFLVPLHMEKAFDLLKNNMLRAKWDVLVNGGSVKEEVRVANGTGSNDAVSILHVKHGHGANRDTMMILQNTCYDASGAFMVYSSLDKQLMEIIGDNQAMSNISLFPAGFSLVPLTDPAGHDGARIAQPGATVMTAGFQILMKLAHGTGLCPRSVTSAVKIMTDNIANIKDALLNSHPVFYKSIQPVN
ncbi:homeobox-leucine zipper protein TF1-like [Miscanthus floridulus]|uniref:homeobox-leucine zipper protein TF1-like n=1 Tax=Miscanthus floridulus TaxID=154761 RepID=UPI0034580624